MRFKHYILTRFSYPDDYPYLEERFKIFHNFTKPSFESQTNTNFTWLIKINPNHKDLYGDFKNINTELISSSLNAHLVPTKYILTSRVDCDDAIHQDYVKNIHELFNQDQSTRIIDGNGYRYISKTKETYTFNRYSNHRPSPFSTLVAPFEDKLTVMCEQHGHLAKRFKVQFHDKKLWLQNIHDHNKLMRGIGHEKINLNLKGFNITL